tara:strand:- start:136 stop:306 length:171 start_codon:yes stop_codon:yes gene_type:complete
MIFGIQPFCPLYRGNGALTLHITNFLSMWYLKTCCSQSYQEADGTKNQFLQELCML